MGSVEWGPEIASTYDQRYASEFEPASVDPVVDALAKLVGGGRALEFGSGTGRIALPLHERGVEVHGIELSAAMAAEHRAKPGADAVPVTVGDMTSTRVAGVFSLVFLLRNTIMNVTTQDEQVAVFENAATHLSPGGRFVVEVIVPQVRRMPRGEPGRIFAMDDAHVGIETLDDVVGQIASSHHWFDVDGQLVHHTAPYRYVWPSELDLMARIAGLHRTDRWADWDGSAFTADSDSQIAVYEKS